MSVPHRRPLESPWIQLQSIPKRVEGVSGTSITLTTEILKTKLGSTLEALFFKVGELPGSDQAP